MDLENEKEMHTFLNVKNLPDEINNNKKIEEDENKIDDASGAALNNIE